MIIGKPTVTTTTSRRSTAWHFPEWSALRSSLKNWTSRDVMHWLCRWRPYFYQQANNHWLRKLAHGPELYLGPNGPTGERRNSFPSYETAALTWTGFPKSELGKMGRRWTRHPTPSMRQLIAEHIHGWLPVRSTDPNSQHEITSLRQRLEDEPTEISTPPGLANRVLLHSPRLSKEHFWGTQHLQPLRPLIQRVYTVPTTSNSWLEENMPTAWLIEPLQSGSRISNCRTLKRPSSRRIKMETWWAKQPAEALETIQKVAVMMGIPVTLLSKNFNASNLIKILTAAISMTNWLAPLLRRKPKHKWLQSCLQVLHSMILVISILTPFTMASTICLFQGFRIIQVGWWCWPSSTAFGPIRSWKQLWKGVPISIICGALHLPHTISFLRHFSSHNASTSVLRILSTCNPSSI